MKKQQTTEQNLKSRLHKIVGQLQGIDKMLDKGASSEEILVQLNAARSALLSCGKIVLEGHLKHCVVEGIEHGDAEKTLENFATAVERFAGMT